jgi:hypothetical protein
VVEAGEGAHQGGVGEGGKRDQQAKSQPPRSRNSPKEFALSNKAFPLIKHSWPHRESFSHIYLHQIIRIKTISSSLKKFAAKRLFDHHHLTQKISAALRLTPPAKHLSLLPNKKPTTSVVGILRNLNLFFLSIS